MRSQVKGGQGGLEAREGGVGRGFIAGGSSCVLSAEHQPLGPLGPSGRVRRMPIWLHPTAGGSAPGLNVPG